MSAKSFWVWDRCFMSAPTSDPCSEVVKKVDYDELKFLVDSATKMVMPGEVDSGDAYLILMREAQGEVLQLKTEVEQLKAAVRGMVKK